MAVHGSKLTIFHYPIKNFCNKLFQLTTEKSEKVRKEVCLEISEFLGMRKNNYLFSILWRHDLGLFK